MAQESLVSGFRDVLEQFAAGSTTENKSDWPVCVQRYEGDGMFIPTVEVKLFGNGSPDNFLEIVQPSQTLNGKRVSNSTMALLNLELDRAGNLVGLNDEIKAWVDFGNVDFLINYENSDTDFDTLYPVGMSVQFEIKDEQSRARLSQPAAEDTIREVLNMSPRYGYSIYGSLTDTVMTHLTGHVHTRGHDTGELVTAQYLQHHVILPTEAPTKFHFINSGIYPRSLVRFLKD